MSQIKFCVFGRWMAVMNKFIHSKLKFFIELTLTEVSKAKKVELFFCLFVVNLLSFIFLFIFKSIIYPFR